MGKRQKIIYIILVVMVEVFAVIGGYYWYESAYFVSTDDAKVAGDLVSVGPQISGKLLELSIEEGDEVISKICWTSIQVYICFASFLPQQVRLLPKSFKKYP